MGLPLGREGVHEGGQTEPLGPSQMVTPKQLSMARGGHVLAHSHGLGLYHGMAARPRLPVGCRGYLPHGRAWLSGYAHLVGRSWVSVG